MCVLRLVVGGCVFCVCVCVQVCVHVCECVCVQTCTTSHLDTQPPHLQNESSYENQYPGVDIQLSSIHFPCTPHCPEILAHHLFQMLQKVEQ